jgi:hypothetical protein
VHCQSTLCDLSHAAELGGLHKLAGQEHGRTIPLADLPVIVLVFANEPHPDPKWNFPGDARSP